MYGKEVEEKVKEEEAKKMENKSIKEEKAKRSREGGVVGVQVVFCVCGERDGRGGAQLVASTFTSFLCKK